VVELHYSIPAIGLDRRLEGNRANRILMVDETNGRQAEYSNQAGVIFELRQVLSAAELLPLPTTCDSCVSLEYSLSIEDQSGSGWLQSDVLLASVENYMAVALGPHFPADTVLGLRRSASPYAPAHSLALTSDGNLWTWLATDSSISDPTTTITETRPLQTALDQLSVSELEDDYVEDCPGSAIETLFLNPDDESRFINIVCPEFSIPSTLLPLYLEMDAMMNPIVAEVTLPRPQAAFPLSALFDYKRFDRTRLTLFQDGRLVAIDADSVAQTITLTPTQIVSLTMKLQQAEIMSPGLSSLEIAPTETITLGVGVLESLMTSSLVLRGTDGFYNGEWEETADILILAELDALLEEMTGDSEPEDLETPVSETAVPGTPTPPDDTGVTPTATPPATPTSSP
jgi:hypothetical protein